MKRFILSFLVALIVTAGFSATATVADAGLFGPRSQGNDDAPRTTTRLQRVAFQPEPHSLSDSIIMQPSAGPTVYEPCIQYRHLFRWRKVCCGSCTAPIQTVLVVDNPARCGCTAAVPVCIPGCCTGEPCVKSRCGLFGRGIVTYEWCNGCRLTVTFNHCGDVLVTYFGS